MNKLRIGIDFHGVITEDTAFFKKLSAAALARGYEVYVISGDYAQKVKEYLVENKLMYTDIFSMLDYFYQSGKVSFRDDGSFRVDDKLWDTLKAEYCSANNIDLHIDDTIRYGQYFTTPFCFYDKVAKKGILGDKIIDLSFSEKKALSEFEKILIKP